MKTILRLAVTLALLATLAGGWVYLYMHSRTVSAEQQNATLGLLKDLKQLDSDWNADVLKSQSEINKSYDPLTRPLVRTAEILSQLDSETKKRGDTALAAAVREIRESIDAKSILVDGFKAQNSLLKNSLRYIPTAHQDLQAQLRAERDGRGTIAAVKLEDQINALVNGALRYYSSPDQASAQSVQSGIEALRAAIPGVPAGQREAIENLTAHLDAVVRLRTQQTKVLLDIAQVPVPAKIEQFSNQLSARFEAELAEQGRYTNMLLVYSAVSLLLVFGAVGNLAWRNATERRRLTVLVERQTRELKDNEVQLIHAQKMNALGEMVAGITHEVNTPLAAVKSGLQSTREVLGSIGEYMQAADKLTMMLATPRPQEFADRRERRAALRVQWNEVRALGEDLASFQAMDTVGDLLDNGVRSVEHIHGVILNMLNFSRLDRSRIAPVKIEEGVESTLAMAKHFLKRVELVKNFAATPEVHCDLAQINQVLLNLVRNAAQALPESGGRIEVETAMQGNDKIRIVVRDNGSGIPPDILPQIWQPFFTTKKEGAGTGLGLSTSKKIVLSHGGTIDVQSQQGVGTAFTIVLPLLPPAEFYEAHGQERQAEPQPAARLAA
jgi:two-component system NtrC family sensor kinase